MFPFLFVFAVCVFVCSCVSVYACVCLCVLKTHTTRKEDSNCPFKLTEVVPFMCSLAAPSCAHFHSLFTPFSEGPTLLSPRYHKWRVSPGHSAAAGAADCFLDQGHIAPLGSKAPHSEDLSWTHWSQGHTLSGTPIPSCTPSPLLCCPSSLSDPTTWMPRHHCLDRIFTSEHPLVASFWT